MQCNVTYIEAGYLMMGEAQSFLECKPQVLFVFNDFTHTHTHFSFKAATIFPVSWIFVQGNMSGMSVLHVIETEQ